MTDSPPDVSTIGTDDFCRGTAPIVLLLDELKSCGKSGLILLQISQNIFLHSFATMDNLKHNTLSHSTIILFGIFFFLANPRHRVPTLGS